MLFIGTAYAYDPATDSDLRKIVDCDLMAEMHWRKITLLNSDQDLVYYDSAAIGQNESVAVWGKMLHTKTRSVCCIYDSNGIFQTGYCIQWNSQSDIRGLMAAFYTEQNELAFYSSDLSQICVFDEKGAPKAVYEVPYSLWEHDLHWDSEPYYSIDYRSKRSFEILQPGYIVIRKPDGESLVLLDHRDQIDNIAVAWRNIMPFVLCGIGFCVTVYSLYSHRKKRGSL